MTGLNSMQISKFFILPCGLTIIVNILPIISFINFFTNISNFETIPIARIISNYINSISFFYYNCIIFNIQIRFINLISAIISFVLMLIYFYLELSRYFLDSILNLILLIIGTSCCQLWMGKIIKEEITVGRIYFITHMTSMLIQIQYVYNCISKKNYLLIPITYDCISFPYYFCWIIYGFLLNDFYILMTNIICCIICLIQIILYFYLKREYLNNLNIEESREIAEESKNGFNSVEKMKERPVKIETNSP